MPAKILVADDEPNIVKLLRLYLREEGYEIVVARNGREALERFRTETPDLVLLDLMMPDMDGWEVYQQMKADPELKDIPVIVVTAKAQSIDKILGLHIAKVDDYVTKPFHMSELIARIKEVAG